MIFEGNLGECIRELLTKPANQNHLYDIFTLPQPAFEQAVLGTADVNEIVGRAEFR